MVLFIMMIIMSDDNEHGNDRKDNGMTDNKISSVMIVKMIVKVDEVYYVKKKLAS